MRLLAALALLVAGAGSLACQERDAFVLSPGQARLTVGASYVRGDSRFSDSPGLASGLNGPLTPDRFPALLPLRTGLQTFFEATSGVPGASQVDLGTLSAGDLALDVTANYRLIPITVAVGILRGLEFSATLPVYRTERLTRGVSLEGGTVGPNANPAALAAQLGGIAPGGQLAGAAAFVPTLDSAVGQELQQRVRLLTGEAVALPAASGGAADYATQLPARYAIGDWQPGDLELQGRLELVRTFERGSQPGFAAENTDRRLTLLASARLPTGRESWQADGLGISPEVGVLGAGAGAAADIFAGKYWLSAGGQVRVVGLPEMILETSASSGGSSIVRGDSRAYTTDAEIWVTPRLRIQEELAFGVTLASELWMGGRETVMGVALDESNAARHSIGGSLRYSDLLPPQGSGRTSLDANLGFRTSIFGSGGVPDTSVAFVQLTLMRSLRGGS